jgi:hypothetical protein
MSEFKVHSGFKAAIDKLRTGVVQAADSAMGEVMARAEKDARDMKRWNDAGTATSKSGIWEWEVTGLAEETITGYVVSKYRNKTLKNVSSRTGRRAANGYEFPPRVHSADPSLTGDYDAGDDTVIGVVTMYPAYANYLQGMELGGSQDGAIMAGQVVVVEVLQRNWHNVYRPLMGRRIEKALTSLGL